MARIFIVSSASGSGKDSIIKKAMEQNPTIAKFVTTTTRPRREGEVEGRDYHFVSTDEFEAMIRRKEMFEHDHHYGYWYGTTIKEVQEAKQYNGPVVWKTDPHGVKFLKERIPDAITIAIIPESRETMEKWLRGRGTDSEDDIQKRLKVAEGEIAYLIKYADRTIVNHDGRLHQAVDEFLSIIKQFHE